MRQSGATSAYQPGLSRFPWYTDDCRQLRQQLRTASRLVPHTPQLRALQRQYQALLRSKRRQYDQQQLQQFCQLLKTDPCKFWQQARLPTSLLPEQLRHPAAWDAYLADLIAPAAQQAHDVPQPHLSADTPAAVELNLTFSTEEIEAGLRRLNNGKAGALLGYTSELLRYGKHPVSENTRMPAHLLAPTLAAVLNTAFTTGCIPEAWRTSLVTPIHKRGDTTDTANYRPIAVGEPLYRLYTYIVN